MELEHLALADQHIVQGERRVSEQMALIAQLTDQGQDTATAKDLLRLLEGTMVQWYDHRRLILEALSRS